MTDLKEIRLIIISLLNTYPNGVPAYKFNMEYQKFVGNDIPFAHYSYINLQSFLAAELKDNVRIEIEPMDIWLFPITNKKSGHIIQMIQQQLPVQNKPGRYSHGYSHRSNSMANDDKLQIPTKSRSPTMPHLIEYKPNENKRASDQEMVKNILVQNRSARPMNTNGTECRSKILKKFRTICAEAKSAKTKPPTQTIGSKPLKASLREPKSTLTPQAFEWESSKENLWEHDLNDLEPPHISRTNSSSYYCVSDGSELLQEVLSQELPELLSFDDDEAKQKLEMTSILDELHTGDVVVANISDINNPFEFWIHLRQKKLKTQFNTMYKEMQEYYAHNRHCDSLKVNDIDIAETCYFALHYYGQWHRVEPLKFKIGESLKVSFVDHGTSVVVNISELRKLPENFLKIPKGAVCCALAHIKPTGRKFSSKSANVFMDLVEGEKFYAKILDIDKEQSKAIIEIILDSNKKCVNDELVRLGLAMSEEK